jgi:hypothetical protein
MIGTLSLRVMLSLQVRIIRKERLIVNQNRTSSENRNSFHDDRYNITIDDMKVDMMR